MQPNWWISGYELIARGADGRLTAVGYDGEREDWLEGNGSLLEMDERYPIAQTGKSEELVLLVDGRLMFRVDDYQEIDEFGPIAALHDDVIETSDGKFYKCEWDGDELDWRPHEQIEARPLYCEDDFVYVYEDSSEPWQSVKYTAICNAGTLTLIEECIPTPGYADLGWEYNRSEITLEMDVIDYHDSYLLCSNGDVICMMCQKVIQQIMVRSRSRKSAI